MKNLQTSGLLAILVLSFFVSSVRSMSLRHLKSKRFVKNFTATTMYANHEAQKLIRNLRSPRHSQSHKNTRQLIAGARRIYGATEEPRSEYMLHSLLDLCRFDTMHCSLTTSNLWRDIHRLSERAQIRTVIKIKLIKFMEEFNDLDYVQQLIAEKWIWNNISIRSALITKYGMNQKNRRGLNSAVR